MKHAFLLAIPFALVTALAAPRATAQSLTAVKIAEGIPNPTYLCSPPGDTARLFVTSKRSGIYIIENGVVLPQLFLDLTPVLAVEGLVCMAFHPDYATNGKFYVVYMDDNQDDHLVQYEVSGDPDVADPTTAQHILGPFPQPDPLHNWDCIQFGPDGMLYFGTGDGVLSSDTTTSNSQDLGSLLGKILRLDVDLPPPHVPPDNPFVGVPGAREEIWSYGLRQPWRFSFDSLTDDLYIADVGKGTREEIDFIAAGSAGGENFGWRCIEGSLCHDYPGCTPDCDDPSWIEPIHEYDHGTGCAIIGGYVYRGPAIPALQGTYFFGDYCTGSIWSFRYDGATMTEFQDRTAELAPFGGSEIDFVTSFGVDSAGELYILEHGADAASSGVFKIASDPCFSETYCTTSPNSVGAGALMGDEGLPSLSLNHYTLTCEDLPPHQFGVFFYGLGQTQAPFGDGVLCVSDGGPGIIRFNPPVSFGTSGEAVQPVDFTLPPASAGPGTIDPGSTWNFQFWYRDPAAGGSGFNLSDGLSVTFCP